MPLPTPSVRAALDLTGRVAVITGGAGLLGRQHAAAIAEMGGTPILLDLNGDHAAAAAEDIRATWDCAAAGLACDITNEASIQDAASRIEASHGHVHILINNAANNPKVEDTGNGGAHWSHLEQFPLHAWQSDLQVGLTGAFLCARVFGPPMAARGSGVILNIASDLALIGPDQRIYRQPGLPDEQQMVKPVTYSVVKAGLIGLTRYLATYWADANVRCNAICPGGVANHQDPDFVHRLANLIPLGRMARPDEYRAAIAFLVSDASSYMTGAIISVDGGRTAW